MKWSVDLSYCSRKQPSELVRLARPSCKQSHKNAWVDVFVQRFFCVAHLRWCHNGWASNILIVVTSIWVRTINWGNFHFKSLLRKKKIHLAVIFSSKCYCWVWRMVDSLCYSSRKIPERYENSFVDYGINNQKLSYLMMQITKDLNSASVLQNSRRGWWAGQKGVHTTTFHLPCPFIDRDGFIDRVWSK